MEICPLRIEESEYCTPLSNCHLKEEMKWVGLENFAIPSCIDVHQWMIGTLPDIVRTKLPSINDQEDGVRKICFCNTDNCKNQDLLKTPSSITILPCNGTKPCLK